MILHNICSSRMMEFVNKADNTIWTWLFWACIVNMCTYCLSYQVPVIIQFIYSCLCMDMKRPLPSLQTILLHSRCIVRHHRNKLKEVELGSKRTRTASVIKPHKSVQEFCVNVVTVLKTKHFNLSNSTCKTEKFNSHNDKNPMVFQKNFTLNDKNYASEYLSFSFFSTNSR